MTKETTDPAAGRAEGVSVKGTALVAIGMTVGQLLALTQMLIVSRALGPVEFGAFGSLAVVLLLGSTAMVATQVVVARHAAMSGAGAMGISNKVIWTVGLGTSAVAGLVSPVLGHVLNMDSVAGLLFIAVAFTPLTFSGAQLGKLQGHEAFTRVGVLYFVVAACRVSAAVACALAFGTATATAAGVMVGTILAALIGAWLARGHQPARLGGGRASVFEIGHAGHALIALYALTNVDVLLARSQLDSRSAGLYAAGQLVNRAVFFLPQAVLVAAFPRMVAQGGGRAQRQATAAIAGLGLLATAMTALLPGLVLAVFAGPQYSQITSSLWIFALAGAGFGVVQVLLYARLAQHDRKAAILMWGGTGVLLLLGITVGSVGVTQLAWCAAGVAWVIALLGLALDARTPTRGLAPDEVPIEPVPDF